MGGPNELVRDLSVRDLKAYLLAHEADIALGINDFGDLSHAFHVIMERPAKADGRKDA